MYQINWTPIAQETHQQIFDFILENWSIDIAIKFDTELQQLLQNLELHKHLCPPLRIKKEIRRCVVSPQVSLLYQIQEQNKTIELLTFYDNRANHPY